MSPQAGWILQEEVVPRLRSSIPRAVRCVGAEDAEELIQDATLIAARMIIRAESLGKLGKITPGNFAYYTLQHCKAGRRSTGSSVVDVMASRNSKEPPPCYRSTRWRLKTKAVPTPSTSRT